MFRLLSGIYLGWGLGANDAANVFGTGVATGVVRYRTAILLTAVFVIMIAVVLTLTVGLVARVSLALTVIVIESVGSLRPMVIAGAALSNVTLNTPEVPMLPALSEALTSSVFSPVASVTFVLKLPELTNIGWGVPLTVRLAVVIVVSLTVPVTVWLAVLVAQLLAGAVILTSGLVLSKAIVTLAEEVLPMASVAATVMVLLPDIRVTLWLKVPPTTGIHCEAPFSVRFAVLTPGSSMVPDTSHPGVLTTLPDTGQSAITSGPVVSSVTVLTPEVPRYLLSPS